MAIGPLDAVQWADHPSPTAIQGVDIDHQQHKGSRKRAFCFQALRTGSESLPKNSRESESHPG